ncbi:hypothetical protein [Algibacter sp. 2305UL17-15]|uniref:hypothetical protein n=1 Tax=Algibacter sp. 2305UL17-15 TaxID=3231268 RepID=UPI0034577B1D
MDLESKKYKIIEKLMKVSDEETLYKIEQIMSHHDSQINALSDLPDIAKQLLKKSEEDILHGRTRPHEEVMAEFKSKYKLD